MKAFQRVGKAFSRSYLGTLVSEALNRKRSDRLPDFGQKPSGRPAFSMEAIEPRMLLSADISYVPAVSNLAATEFTLRAVNDGGLKIRLFDNLDNVVGSATFDTADGVVNVSRAGGAVVQSVVADTVTIDLSTFEVLNTSMSGDGVTINFTGGAQDFFSDSVVLSGTADLDYDLTIASDADILVKASVHLTADDISLSVSMTDSGLPPAGDEFFADADADIDVYGDLFGQDISLSATSTLKVDNDSLGLSSLQIAFIYANSSAEIDIGGGAQISATGALAVSAKSDVYANASMASLAGKTDTSTDAAVAGVVVLSNAAARVAGNADLDVTGAFTLDASSRVVGSHFRNQADFPSRISDSTRPVDLFGVQEIPLVEPLGLSPRCPRDQKA